LHRVNFRHRHSLSLLVESGIKSKSPREKSRGLFRSCLSEELVARPSNEDWIEFYHSAAHKQLLAIPGPGKIIRRRSSKISQAYRFTIAINRHGPYVDRTARTAIH